jgi:hypothetical protein
VSNFEPIFAIVVPVAGLFYPGIQARSANPKPFRWTISVDRRALLLSPSTQKLK